MNGSPSFASRQEFRAHIADLDFWWPHLAEALNRHGRVDAAVDPVPGYNPTFPTFLYGDIVIKVFGFLPSAHRSYVAERNAHALLATDPEILAPAVLASGNLYDDDDAPWPYLITSRIPGVAAPFAEVSREQRLSLAKQLGKQIQRVHALPHTGVATHDDWPALDVAAAVANSSLPPHLVMQVDDYLARITPFDDVFVHGDLAAMHVFVDDGRISGIIDWGDAMVTDRHYEIIQIHRDTFRCEKEQLRVFLEASKWPVDDDFPYKAMAHALYRQTIMLTQHQGGDVFEPVAALFPLDEIATLDELAIELFGV
ncbi:MAG: phosphotransferase family protein [Chloroflexota bacterium]